MCGQGNWDFSIRAGLQVYFSYSDVRKWWTICECRGDMNPGSDRSQASIRSGQSYFLPSPFGEFRSVFESVVIVPGRRQTFPKKHLLFETTRPNKVIVILHPCVYLAVSGFGITPDLDFSSSSYLGDTTITTFRSHEYFMVNLQNKTHGL